MPRRSVSTTLTTAWLLAASLALAGCGGDDGSGASSAASAAGVEVTDSAGVRIVENTGPGGWGDGDAWTVEEIFRVGGLDAGTDAQFGLVLAVDVDDAGNVYVADNQARQVSVFGPDGELVTRFGQAGEGPGEFGPMLMGMFERDGEIWTVDPGAQGIQRFTSAGEFVGATPFDIMGGVPMRMDETADAVVAQRRSMGMDGQFESVGATGDAVTTIGTATPDTIVVLPPGETVRVVDGEPRIVMFAPEPFWDLAPDGSSVRGMMSVYRLEVRDAEGRLQRVVARDVEPTPVTEQMENRMMDLMREQFESMGMPMEAMGSVFSEMEFAETLPVMIQAFLEPDGHLWVQRSSDISALDDEVEAANLDVNALAAARWDIFDPDGVYLGELELPERFQPLRIIDGVLWGVATDELDVQSVLGMRVVR